MWYGDRVNYNLATKAGTSKKKKNLWIINPRLSIEQSMGKYLRETTG